MLILTVFLLGLVSCKSILLTNDDSWISTNIRATYRDLKKAGYDVLLVAPVSQRSGWSGRFQLPQSKSLEVDGEFGYVKAGAPSWGHESDDHNVWYFNGTPASCVAFAADYLVGKQVATNFSSIDLVVAGPNEDPNLTPGFYTNSGTMGAAYTALYRGIPAISFSGSDTNNSFFKDFLNDDKGNPANIYANKVVELVDKYFEASGSLPPTTGLNVNFPPAGNLNASCQDPEWEFTRLMGTGIFQQAVKYNDETQLFDVDYKHIDNIEPSCTNGDCSLRSEYEVFFEFSCKSTISLFSIDYGANEKDSQSVRSLLGF